MKPELLVTLTAQRISHLSEVELLHSFDCRDDYPLQFQELLDAIHNGEHERIGKALMLFLYSHNQFDIELHEGL